MTIGIGVGVFFLFIILSALCYWKLWTMFAKAWGRRGRPLPAVTVAPVYPPGAAYQQPYSAPYPAAQYAPSAPYQQSQYMSTSQDPIVRYA